MIHEKMIAVMAEVGAIGKDSRNQQQGFNFRGIDTVYNELHDIMAQQGIYTIPEVLEERSEERQTKNGGTLIYRILKIKYTFFAEDGTNVVCVVIGEGMDSGDKAASKAMSIAHKYALLQAFCIPTKEQKDPDAESYVVGAKIQPAANMQAREEYYAVFRDALSMADLQAMFAVEYRQASAADKMAVVTAKDIRKKELTDAAAK
jgi:hypothetical protein